MHFDTFQKTDSMQVMGYPSWIYPRLTNSSLYLKIFCKIVYTWNIKYCLQHPDRQQRDTALDSLADLKAACYALVQLRTSPAGLQRFRRSGACNGRLQVRSGQTGGLTQTGLRTFGRLMLEQRRLRIMWWKYLLDQALFYDNQ